MRVDLLLYILLGWQEFCSFSRASLRHLASYFILSMVIIVISPFCQLQIFFQEKIIIRKKGKKSNFYLAVDKGCVQQFVNMKYLTGSILGTLNNGILKLIDA